jgi:hypothetical protein
LVGEQAKVTSGMGVAGEGVGEERRRIRGRRRRSLDGAEKNAPLLL